jgi:hypothetical protein
MQVVIHVLRHVDVGDSIEVERAAKILERQEPTRGATILRGPEPSPSAGVVLRREPLDLKLGRVDVGLFQTDARVRIFDFGSIAIRFTLRLTEPTPSTLIDLANRLSREGSAFDAKARALWANVAVQIRDAVVPWEKEEAAAELTEEFTVFVLPCDLNHPLCSERVFAHVLLGEPEERKLAASTVQDVSSRAIRYYDDDLVLVDYDAAIIVDKEEPADLVDIFEIATAQLLELRFYDAMLSQSVERLLHDVRRARTTAWLIRSPFRKLARRAAILALELGEMTDRLERVITLVGDTYSAQIYREAAVRFRLAEARTSVREKVGIIERVSGALGHEIHARRDLILETLVILLIAIEIVIAFRH